MNLSDTLRGLWRRWYIVVPGVVLAAAAAIGTWAYVAPDYERSGTQLLLPGTSSIPDSSNPYLFLGGLSQAADVLVTSMSADSVHDSLLAGHPGAEIVVIRDPLTSGPQIQTTVTARSNAEAREILAATLARTKVELGDLQDSDGIVPGNRITVKSITVDDQSTLIQKTRILAVAGAALAVLLLTLLVAGLVEGLSSRRRRRASAESLPPVTGSAVDVDGASAEPVPTVDETSPDDAPSSAGSARKPASKRGRSARPRPVAATTAAGPDGKPTQDGEPTDPDRSSTSASSPVSR